MIEELEGGFPKPCKHDLVDIIAWHVNNSRKADAQAILDMAVLDAKIEVLKEFQGKFTEQSDKND